MVDEKVHYELVQIWRTTQTNTGIIHDHTATLPIYGDDDMTDSESITLGSPKKIVDYILKNDLKEYKLVKKKGKI